MPYVVEIVDDGINLSITSPVIEIQLSSTQGPAGPPGPPGPPGSQNQVAERTRPPASTVVLDRILLTNVTGCKWHVYAVSASLEVGFLEVMSTNKADFTVSNIFDDNTPMTMDVQVNGTNLELLVTNESAEDVDYYALRFVVDPTLP